MNSDLLAGEELTHLVGAKQLLAVEVLNAIKSR